MEDRWTNGYGDVRQRKGATILLVEDNPAHAELVMRSFEKHAAASRIAHVSDGEAALEYLFKRGVYGNPATSPRPRVVLLDLRLPKISGLDVLQAIRQSPELHNLPVIVLTTSQTQPDIAEAYARHANSYLVKPVDFEKFSNLMRDLGVYWLEWNEDPSM